MQAIQFALPLEIPEMKPNQYTDPMIEELIRWYRPPGPIGHIDLNKFFAALALKRRPDLRDLPFGVHDPDRGTPLMAVNELASECGFDSAMRVGDALNICRERKEQGREKCQTCPGLQLAIDDPEMQAEASNYFFRILEDCNPGRKIARYGIDEAFIDYSDLNYNQAMINFEKTIETVNKKMGAKYGLSASGCLAPNQTLAKNGTNWIKKKKGLVWLPINNRSQVKIFYSWPVQKFHGIGPEIAQELNKIGVETVGDLAKIPLPVLKSKMGKVLGTQLYLLSHGIDAYPVEPSPPEKSIGRSIACKFQQFEHVQGRMRIRAGTVAREMQRQKVLGNIVIIKLEFFLGGERHSRSSQKTLSNYFNDQETIFQVGKELLFPLYLEVKEVIKTEIRRIEVRVRGITPQNQLRLL